VAKSAKNNVQEASHVDLGFAELTYKNVQETGHENRST
jgi:hypothetical protein